MEGIGPQQNHPVRNQNAAGAGDVHQPAQQPPQQPPQPAAAETSNKKWYYPTLESKIVVIILMLAAIVVLTTFIAGLFHQKVTVSDFVRSDQHQAVFLNNGQVYFGHITGTNGDTLILENIYYLQVDQQLQPEEEGAASEDPQVSLAKLGDEMHGPEDQMFINREQITFWENLREDGQVSQAISQFEQQGEGGNIDAEAAEDELPGDVDTEEQTGQDPAEQDDPASAEDDSADSE